MKILKTGIIFLSFLSTVTVKAQKTISEGSLVYNISIQLGNSESQQASSTIYISGEQSRSELVSGLGSDVTIYDSKKGSGVVLKDYSGQKLMITLSKEDWNKRNSKYEGITFETTNETATVAGYNCKKAIAKLKDGTSFEVYYTTEVQIAGKEYDPQFKNLPGLALQYEWQTGKIKYKYTLSKINFDAVALSKFDIPKSGYRVMTYDEAKK